MAESFQERIDRARREKREADTSAEAVERKGEERVDQLIQQSAELVDQLLPQTVEAVELIRSTGSLFVQGVEQLSGISPGPRDPRYSSNSSSYRVGKMWVRISKTWRQRIRVEEWQASGYSTTIRIPASGSVFTHVRGREGRVDLLQVCVAEPYFEHRYSIKRDPQVDVWNAGRTLSDFIDIAAEYLAWAETQPASSH